MSSISSSLIAADVFRHPIPFHNLFSIFLCFVPFLYSLTAYFYWLLFFSFFSFSFFSILSSALSHSILPSSQILLSTLSSILIVGYTETNVPLSLSPALVLLIRIYSPCWSSVGGQTGIHYRVFMCVRARSLEMNQSLSVCVNVFERKRDGGEKKHFGCESQHVCPISCTYHSVYGSHGCVCVSSCSLGRLAWMRWEESVVALAGEPRLIWCLFASTLCGTCQPETHTCCDVLRYSDTVYASMFELESRSLWHSSQRINWFIFSILHSCATWYTSCFV